MMFLSFAAVAVFTSVVSCAAYSAPQLSQDVLTKVTQQVQHVQQESNQGLQALQATLEARMKKDHQQVLLAMKQLRQEIQQVQSDMDKKITELQANVQSELESFTKKK